MNTLVTNRQYLAKLAYAIAAATAFYVLAINIAIIFFPWQIDSREGAVLLQVIGRLNGTAVWDVEALPQYLNAYGLLYPEVGAVFASFLGTSFATLRLVTFLAILGSTLAMNAIFVAAGLDPIRRTLLCIAFFVGQIFLVGAHAKADALGMLIFTLGLYLMETRHHSSRVLSVVILLSYLGFLAKAYFLLLGPLACSYVYFYVSKRQGLILSAIFLLGFCVLIVALDSMFPTYVTSVIGVVTGARTEISFDSSTFMLRQWAYFLLMHLGVLLLGVAWKWRGGVTRGPGEPRWWSEFWGYSAAVIAIVLTVSLGHHVGNFLTYFNNLLLPFLLVGLARRLPVAPDERGKGLLMASVVTAITATTYMPSLKVLVAGDVAGLKKLETLVNESSDVLAVSVVAGLLASQGRPVHDSGQSEYLASAGSLAALKVPGLGLEKAVVQAIVEGADADIKATIIKRKFDLALTYERAPDGWISALHENGYEVQDRIILSPPFYPAYTILVWRRASIHAS